VILKARQTGVTQTLALAALSRALRFPVSHSLIVSKGDREAQEASARVRQMYSSLPAQVKRQHRVFHSNLEVFRLLHPDLPQPDPNSPHDSVPTCDIRNLPAGAGRSYATDFLVADEFDWYDNAEQRMADIEPTLSLSGTLVIASTANGFGGALHARWLRAQTNPRARAIFVGAQAPPHRTERWIEERRASLEHLGPQEHPLSAAEAFISTGHGAFDPDSLMWQSEHVVRQVGGTYHFEKDRAVRSASGRWLVWEAPQRDRRYLIGADPAGGGPHSDPSAACVYDIDAGVQVAAYHGRPLPHQFARELANAGTIYNEALLVPEANNHGQAVIAHLGHLGYGHIYRQERYTVANGKGAERQTLGWLTNMQTKQLAVDALRTQLRERTIGIRDGEAIEEMMRFHETQPGRYAGRGGHDDRCLSHAIAAAVLAHSPRTRHRQPQVVAVGLTREVQDERVGY
jgi:hypothetical protein